MSKVLLISNSGDIHTDLLVDSCRRLGVSYFRLNTDHFRKFGELSWNINDFNLRLSIDKHNFYTNELKLIVYRRPIRAYDSNKDFPEWQNRLIDNEWKSVELSFSVISNIKIINPIAASTIARNKLIQLQFAIRAGLKIPKTLLSTSKNELLEFVDRYKCITKGIDTSYIFDKDNVRTGFTKTVSKSIIENYNMKGYPTLIQEAIIPKAIWRIVYIDSKIFGVRYIGNALLQEQDSRLINDKLIGKPTRVPKEVILGMKNLCQNLGILFASSDFIEDASGHLFFLDLNPDGQWAWLDNQYGLKIADTIIRLANLN